MDIWTIVIFLLIAQGLFNVSLFTISYVNKKQVKTRFLLVITIILIWILLEFLFIRQTIKIPVNLFYGTRYGSWFLLGPLTYLFFQDITSEKKKFLLKDVFHFLPFILFTIIIPILSEESLSRRQIHYGMLSVFDYRPKNVTWFEYLYSTIFYVQFIHLAIYLVFNLRHINTFVAKLKKEYSSIKNIAWMRGFNIILIAILFFASLYLYILFKSDIYSRTLDYIYILPIGVFIYVTSYKIFQKKWQPIVESAQYKTSTLKNEEKEKWVVAINKYMLEEKPFLDNELRLNILAKRMSIKDHHLSQILNEKFNSNFYDFINGYRVKKAKEDIIKYSNKNLLRIAFESGFNNKTSFVNAFKKYEGITPSEFKHQQNKN